MSNAIKTSVTSALDSIGFSSPTNSSAETLNSERRRLEKIAVSSQFKNGKAIARMPKVQSPESMLSVMWKLVCGRNRLKPQVELPYLSVDTLTLSERSQEPRVTWLGHSSLFIELDKTRILIDPV
ncbi:beta-lactamase, partial [Vibrio xuii]